MIKSGDIQSDLPHYIILQSKNNFYFCNQSILNDML